MKGTSPPEERLTRREQDIVALLGQQLTDREIAERLVLSLNSVKWYTRQVYGKLGVANRRDAVAKARELGLIAGERPVEGPRHNLPHPISRLVGREREIEQVAQMVRGYPLVTLIGAGGVGKTRLGQAAAWELVGDFEGGVWLAALASLAAPGLVGQSVAEALGIRQEPGRTLLDSLRSRLADRQALVVLDNCEHLLGACAELAEGLLNQLPRLKILATSREPLGVNGEAVFYVPSMDYPMEEAQLTPESAQGYASVRLFVERVQAIQPEFGLNEANASYVGLICRRMDGIPLAIELAAARMRVLRVEQIAERLEDIFGLLAGGSRAALPRHRTLRACIDWSYDLLSEKEQALLARLSVFAGGWTLEAAEEVCSDDGVSPLSAASAAEEVRSNVDRVSIPGSEGQVWKPDLRKEEVLNLLSGLVDRSLVQFDLNAEGEPRYRMLETVRQYARERLVQQVGGGELLFMRHLDYFLALGLKAGSQMHSYQKKVWLGRLVQEQDNLRTALGWSLTSREQPFSGLIEKGLSLATALQFYWPASNHIMEGVQWTERLLQEQKNRQNFQLADQDSRIIRGRAMNVLGNLLSQSFDYQYLTAIPSEQIVERIQALSQESMMLFSGLGDAYRMDYAHALFNQAGTAADYLKCLHLLSDAGERIWIGLCYQRLAKLSWNDYEKSAYYFKKNISLQKEIGDIEGEGWATFYLGFTDFSWGNQKLAVERMTDGLACMQKAGHQLGVLFQKLGFVLMEIAQGNYQGAEFLLDTLEVEAYKLKHFWFVNEIVVYRAIAAWAKGSYSQTLFLCQKAYEPVKDIPGSHPGFFYVLGRVALSQGDLPKARDYLVDSTRLACTYNHTLILHRSINALGQVADREGEALRAVTLFGAVNTVWAFLWNWLAPPESSESEQALETSRACLSEEAYTEAWATGQAMTIEQLYAYALTGVEKST